MAPRRTPASRSLSRFADRLRFLHPRAPGRKRRHGRDLDDGGVPVEPNKPTTLTGGAAAQLEFDDDTPAS